MCGSVCVLSVLVFKISMLIPSDESFRKSAITLSTTCCQCTPHACAAAQLRFVTERKKNRAHFITRAFLRRPSNYSETSCEQYNQLHARPGYDMLNILTVKKKVSVVLIFRSDVTSDPSLGEGWDTEDIDIPDEDLLSQESTCTKTLMEEARTGGVADIQPPSKVRHPQNLSAPLVGILFNVGCLGILSIALFSPWQATLPWGSGRVRAR